MFTRHRRRYAAILFALAVGTWLLLCAVVTVLNAVECQREPSCLRQLLTVLMLGQAPIGP